jgi:nicotinamide-nucleotide amidase
MSRAQEIRQMCEDLVTQARDAGVMIATAESCTGGGIATAITEVAGASAVLDRGFVTYSNAAKIEMLGVSAATLEAFGAVSERVASEMASGALARSGAALSVAVTGIAGPGGSEHKPEGRVCFAVAQTLPEDRSTLRIETIDFGALGRAEVRRETVAHALSLMLTELAERGS